MRARSHRLLLNNAHRTSRFIIEGRNNVIRFFFHMEIGRFASAAMCLLVAKAAADYLLIHVLLFKIVPFFFFFLPFQMSNRHQ